MGARRGPSRPDRRIESNEGGRGWLMAAAAAAACKSSSSSTSTDSQTGGLKLKRGRASPSPLLSFHATAMRRWASTA